MVTVGHQALSDFLFINLYGFRKLRNRRLALVLLLELVDFVINLAQRAHLIQRQTHNAALLGNGLQDALANPPNSVRNEFETTSLVKFLCGFNQSNVTLIDEVCECESLMLVLLGNGHHKS